MILKGFMSDLLKVLAYFCNRKKRDRLYFDAITGCGLQYLKGRNTTINRQIRAHVQGSYIPAEHTIIT